MNIQGNSGEARIEYTTPDGVKRVDVLPIISCSGSVSIQLPSSVVARIQQMIDDAPPEPTWDMPACGECERLRAKVAQLQSILRNRNTEAE